METDLKFRQWLNNQHPDDYRRLLKIEEANREAMLLPKNDIIARLEGIGFCRGAVSAFSDTHYCSSPKDKIGEYSVVVQIGDGIYNRSGERSITYDQGVEVWRSYGHILKEGFYKLEEFDLLLDRLEGSHWYLQKKANKAKVPVLSMLQRKVYDSLPQIFSWAQGKEIAFNACMPGRTAQRFFGNQVLFHKVKNGTYMKKIVFDTM